MSHVVRVAAATRKAQGQVLVKHLPTLQAVCRRLGYREPHRIQKESEVYHTQISQYGNCEFNLATGDERLDSDYQQDLAVFRREYESEANQILKQMMLEEVARHNLAVNVLTDTPEDILLCVPY